MSCPGCGVKSGQWHRPECPYRVTGADARKSLHRPLDKGCIGGYHNPMSKSITKGAEMTITVDTETAKNILRSNGWMTNGREWITPSRSNSYKQLDEALTVCLSIIGTVEA